MSACPAQSAEQPTDTCLLPEPGSAALLAVLCNEMGGWLTGAGKSVIATDVLWSDPAAQPGLVENEARGVGLLFGPDVTQVTTAYMLPVWVMLQKYMCCLSCCNSIDARCLCCVATACMLPVCVVMQMVD